MNVYQTNSDSSQHKKIFTAILDFENAIDLSQTLLILQACCQHVATKSVKSS